MATRLTAKGALTAELLRLGELRAAYLRDSQGVKDKAVRKEYRDLMNEADMRIQALRYALNFLEGEEEVVCPD